MTFVLLLGAGFSRNWGGWLADELFAFLLGHRAIRANAYLREEIWRQRNAGHDFEDLLGHVRRKLGEDPANQSYIAALISLEVAISDAFGQMNARFMEGMPVSHPLSQWLTRFDAIFTLNQDILLEASYLSRDLALLAPGKWNGSDLPGMVPAPGQPLNPPRHWSAGALVPETDLKCAAGSQPYYKLHGSANWTDGSGKQMLIMGSDKSGQIAGDRLIGAYLNEFGAHLARKPCRLMVIGYSFRDRHINAVIEASAAGGGLEIFIVDPKGVEVTRGKEQLVPGAVGMGVNRIELPFQSCIIGFSTRSFVDSIHGYDPFGAALFDAFFMK